MMSSVSRAKPDVTMLSDASGNWGCGALSGLDWFQLQWAGPIKDYHITVKELVPMVTCKTRNAEWNGIWNGIWNRIWNECTDHFCACVGSDL